MPMIGLQRVGEAPPEYQFLQTLVKFQLQRNILIFKDIFEENHSYLPYF